MRTPRCEPDGLDNSLISAVCSAYCVQDSQVPLRHPNGYPVSAALSVFGLSSPGFGCYSFIGGIRHMINPLILAFLLGSGCAPMPEKPDPHSIAFVCSLHGFRVLEGWITVSEARAEIAEEINLDQYWLDCDSRSLEGLKCRTASQ